MGRVDNGQSSIPGTRVQFINTSSQKVVATAQTDFTGLYSVSIEPGTYDIVINPPLESGASQVRKKNQKIENNTVINFNLPSHSNLVKMETNQSLWLYGLVGFGAILIVSIVFFIWKRKS